MAVTLKPQLKVSQCLRAPATDVASCGDTAVGIRGVTYEVKIVLGSLSDRVAQW